MATKNLGLVTAIQSGNVEPPNKKILWFDDRVGEKALRYYNAVTGLWEKLHIVPDARKIIYTPTGEITINSSDDPNSDDSDTMASTALTKQKANLVGGNSLQGDQVINGSMTVNKDLTVLGTFKKQETEDLSVSDNIIELNVGESGSGVAIGYSGIQIDRGLLQDVGIIFDESDQTLKFGIFNTITGKVFSSNGNTVVLDANASSVNGAYVGEIIKFFKINEASKDTTITNYVGATKTATLAQSGLGIDNTWGYRILVDQTLYPIIDINGKFSLLQYANVNGDRDQNFAAKILSEAGVNLIDKYLEIGGDRNEDFAANTVVVSKLQTLSDKIAFSDATGNGRIDGNMIVHGVGFFKSGVTGQAVRLYGDRIMCLTDGGVGRILGLNDNKTVFVDPDGSLHITNASGIKSRVKVWRSAESGYVDVYNAAGTKVIRLDGSNGAVEALEVRIDSCAIKYANGNWAMRLNTTTRNFNFYTADKTGSFYFNHNDSARADIYAKNAHFGDVEGNKLSFNSLDVDSITATGIQLNGDMTAATVKSLVFTSPNTKFSLNESRNSGLLYLKNSADYIKILADGYDGSISCVTLTQTSDRRSKEHIKNYNPVEKYIQAVEFNFKDDKAKIKHIGYIAQEVEKIFPYMISHDKKGLKSVNYIEVHTAKIAALEKENREIREENKTMRKELELIKSKLGI